MTSPIHTDALRYIFQLSVANWKQRSFVGRGTLLDKGDKNVDTPLLLAAGHSKLEAFRFLKETGADINIRDA